jgi:hypothetical protein
MVASTERIRGLKTEAKNRRDRGLRDYARAVALLEEAIRIGAEGLDHTNVSEVQSQLANELADCHGLVGGIQRRWAEDGPAEERNEHLRASIRAYDTGYKFESDPRYGIVNSYNLLNRLISRLLLRPDLLSIRQPVDLGPDIETLDVRQELERAAETIREQLAGARRGDYWALADLALVQLLLGKADPVNAYAEFNSLSPPDFAYTSALAALRPLGELPLTASPVIKRAVSVLESRLESLR